MTSKNVVAIDHGWLGIGSPGHADVMGDMYSDDEEAAELGAPDALEGTHKVSLHDRIWSETREKILSGAWAPGYRIPYEHELAAEYACSRMTVNKVLTRLARAGLIERRRKAGSFVNKPATQSAVLQIQDIGSEVASLRQSYRLKLLRKVQRHATGADQERLGLKPNTSILEVNCCHFAGREPFCLEERLINLAAVPEATTEDFSVTPPGTWLLSRVPWTTAEHTIKATGVSGESAGILKLAPGSPCLVIERKTWGAEQPVTYVRLTYPADAHQLVARFHPSDEAQ